MSIQIFYWLITDLIIIYFNFEKKKVEVSNNGQKKA